MNSLCRNHAELANLFYMEMARDLEELQKEFAGIVESLRQTEASLVADLNKKRKSSEVHTSQSNGFDLYGIDTFFFVCLLYCSKWL